MKILIYGAGVIGSYLAHILLKTENNVTLLARGKRLEEIKNDGLRITHFLQRKKTCDNVSLVESLSKEDKYDMVFIVMTYSNIQDILPIVARNKGCKHFVFIGNNPSSKYVQNYIDRNSKIKKDILFGFLSVGGRKENGEIVSVHAKRVSSLTLGSLNDNENYYKDMISKIFSKTDLKIEYHKDINAMLITHVAFILPLVFACYAYNGDLKLAVKTSKFRYKIIKAIDEGFKVVENHGIMVTPDSQVNLVRYKSKKASIMLKFIGNTPFGRLGISDHAMAATSEMKALELEFSKLYEDSKEQMQNWIELRKYLMG